MNSLPREIFGNIVSRLKLADWITCVNVCQAWRVMVPVEVRKSLNRMAIVDDTMSRLDSIRHFPSIRTVSLHGSKIATKAPSLLSPSQITTLELVNISMVDDHLIAVLKPFSHHLRRLTIKTSIWQSTSFAKVVGTFPNLEHFGFFSTARSTMRDNFLPAHVMVGADANDNNECIEQLRLDPLAEDHHSLVSLELSRFVLQDSLLGILQRLPRLQILRFDADYLFLDPIHILRACPRLKLLHEGPHPFAFQPTDWDLLLDPHHPHLSYFSMRMPTDTLFQAMDTDHLQVLHLPNIYQLPTSITSFPHLHTLSCQEISSSSSSSDPHLLASLLTHSPCLEYLYLHEYAVRRHRNHPRLTKPLVDAIVQLPRLRGLYIQSNAWHEPLAVELLRRLDHSRITHLCLKLWEIDPVIETVLTMRALQELRLETLHRWTHDGSGSPSLRLRHLKALKKFQLNLEGAPVTRKELLEMKHLQVIQLTGSHAPCLRDLASLVHLAPRLKTLSIVCDTPPFDDDTTTTLAQEKNHLLKLGADLGIDMVITSACTYRTGGFLQPFCI